MIYVMDDTRIINMMQIEACILFFSPWRPIYSYLFVTAHHFSL